METGKLMKPGDVVRFTLGDNATRSVEITGKIIHVLPPDGTLRIEATHGRFNMKGIFTVDKTHVSVLSSAEAFMWILENS